MSTAMDIPRRIQGAPRFEIAAQVSRCVTWLKVNGFDVLSVQPGPRITIKPSALCDKLEGVVESYSRTRKGEQRFKMVMRWECCVCWDVTPSKSIHPVVSLYNRFMLKVKGMVPYGR
jgi:hypothetical protein